MYRVSAASLQNLCLQKLVEHFEHYPPELLACLPPTLRRLLLVHLPIVDICQLENTCAFDGVDADTIWEQLYKKNVPKYFSPCFNEFISFQNVVDVRDTLEKKQAPFRERYLSLIANILLNRARPSGYYAAMQYRPDSKVDVRFDSPPKSVLATGPIDIVNSLVAGEEVKLNQAEEEEPTLDAEADCNEEGSIDTDEEDIEWGSNMGDDAMDKWIEDECEFSHISIVATTDYDYECQDRYPRRHFLEFDCGYEYAHMGCQYFPPRYDRYGEPGYSYRLSDEDAIRLLVEKCNYHPEHLSVCASAYNSSCWNTDLLRELLHSVVSLKLSFDRFAEGTKETEELLTAVLSKPNPKLSSLVLDLVADLYCESKDQYGYYTSDNYATDDHLAQLARLSSSTKASPLCTLKELSVHGRFTADGLNKLGTVIGTQLSLSSLSIRSFLPRDRDFQQGYDRQEVSNCSGGVCGKCQFCYLKYNRLPDRDRYNDQELYDFKMAEPCVCSQTFVDALISYLRNPNFDTVTLTNIKFPLNLFQQLVAAYLTSPCSHDQSMTLRSIIVEDVGSASTNECVTQKLSTPESVFQHKSLDISVRELESSKSFSSCLRSLQPLNLRRLKVSCHDQLYRRSDFNPQYNFHAHDETFPVVAENTSFHVESLSLCQPSSISAEGIRKLLRNDSLKILELKYCGATLDLSNIAEHVIKHLSESTLEELRIEEDGVYWLGQHFSDESITLFSDTLFSLPPARVSYLSLELSLTDTHLCRDIPNFIEIMYESWKKKRPQKLKKFVLYSRDVDTRYVGQSEEQIANEMGLCLSQ